MKKLITLILMVSMMIAPALACENSQPPVLIATSSTIQTTFTDASWWALTEDHILAGIKEPGESIPHLGMQTVNGMYVAGPIDHGWMRQAGAIRTVDAGGQIAGLTLLRNVTITINEEWLCLAETVVHELLGEDVLISANAIAACATWYSGAYASTIFFPSYSDRFVVGSVTFNNEDVTPLCLGHFGDQLRFGLMCGWWLPEPEQPEPIPEQPKAESSACASASAQAAVNVQNSGSIDNSGDGCYRNNLIIQVNVASWVKNCLKVIKEACQ